MASPTIIPIRCADCGCAVGFQLSTDSDKPAAPIYCYLCMHSRCDFHKVFGIYNGRPDAQDLYRQSTGNQIAIDRRWSFLTRLEKFK